MRRLARYIAIRHTTPHQTTPHHTTPHHTKPHHTKPHHTILTKPNYITPYQTASHYITPHQTTSHYTTPHHTTQHHTTPHHTTQHHTTPHHTTPTTSLHNTTQYKAAGSRKLEEVLGKGESLEYHNFQHLVMRMLTYDPLKRLTPYQALRHPFFAPSVTSLVSLPPSMPTTSTHSLSKAQAKAPPLKCKNEFFSNALLSPKKTHTQVPVVCIGGVHWWCTLVVYIGGCLCFVDGGSGVM